MTATPNTTDRPLPGTTLAWLLSALALTLIPHLGRLPFWVSGSTLGLGALRWLLHRRDAPLPPRWLLLIVALIGATGIFVYYGTLLGKSAGVALLVLMVGCKLLEMSNVRDTMLVIFLGYFLVITNLLYSQDIPIALYLLVAVWALTATLIELTHPGRPLKTSLQFSGRLLLQAIPLMVLMFLLFPRINAPLWGLPKDASAGSTGLSDRMRPGAISQLSQSSAVAFRAHFNGLIPPSPQRYWRGPVFWHTNGREWYARRPGERPLGAGPPSYVPLGANIDYTVTLEPHRQHWLFALDLPASVETANEITSDFQALASRPVNEVRRYTARSHTAYRTTEPTERERRRALQLPAEVSERVRALADSWRRSSNDPAQIVTHALRHFREQPFVYTLNPPLLGADPTDEFLFDTRRGFCEHYAAAFTILMRLAGVPTRIVTGYQGGELNPLGEYLIIRQSDAHAWAEVLLPNRGWVRVDPTAAVAPERIEHGIQPILEEVGEPVRFRLIAPDFLAYLTDQARYLWDGLQIGWNLWVLAYGPELQQRFIQWLGLGGFGWRGMSLALVFAIALLLGVVTYSLLRQRRPLQDPVVASYQRFCGRAARHGLPRLPHEGPLDYARRLSAARPEWKTQVEIITRLYVALRYGAQTPAAWREQLEQQVRTFRP